MTHSDLRKKFIEFWKEKPRNHAEIPSASLVPENDPTTLFTGSGMQPMMPYLLGRDHPLGSRLVDIQKCFRGQDIEEVGDNRHDSFFEMMGNWSLGNYFKKEQISWYFEFITKRLGLPKEKLSVSIFGGDNQFDEDAETAEIWKLLGISEDHIHPYGADKNWWSRAGTPDEMPIGEPGGPDSEVFYDFGTTLKIHENSNFKNQPCHPNCDCGRFIEIGNSVFMTYLKTTQGFVPLKKKNIDFGGGLERTLAAINDDPDIFKTDLYTEIISTIQEVSSKNYADDRKAFRIIADHMKASVFLISDGVIPANKMQGYFLRRLLRRSMVKMGVLKSDDFARIAKSVFKTYSETDYFKNTDKEYVLRIIADEWNKFAKTIEQGIKKIDQISPFDLFQSYGFPAEITEELYKEKGLVFDRNKFDEEFKHHQELSRSASTGMFKGGLADNSETVTKYHTTTHLLQAALRKILGDQVHQEGSNLTTERLRLDFSHPKKLTPEEIKRVEDLVNEQIGKGLDQKMEVMTYDQAIKSGALALFKERYPEKVNVYSFGDPSDSSGQAFSREICGGPHVKNTNELGKFKIIKDEAISSGVRRIYGKII